MTWYHPAWQTGGATPTNNLCLPSQQLHHGPMSWIPWGKGEGSQRQVFGFELRRLDWTSLICAEYKDPQRQYSRGMIPLR